MAATSSLSSLSRTPTPFSRYQTAEEAASNPGEDVTDISSPGEVGDDHFANNVPYRDARDLPDELKSRCQIHLEEQTYAAALSLLNSLLCDGTAHADASTGPALVPPFSQLRVLATLAIQPRHTSKPLNSVAHDVASLSLSYLRSILAAVGPVNGKLRDAFLFHSEGGRRRRSSNDFPRNGAESDEDHIRGKTANSGSIWTRGQDFWKVLGWAFNCSALYPHRWRWWKPWLEYMLDVLEADYEERRRLDSQQKGKKEDPDYPLLRDSLLVSYITSKNSRSSPVKPIMSALFADGSASSRSIYKEVFKKETRIASKTSKKRKRHQVDLENDNFGDYDGDSSTGGSEPPTPEHQRTSAKTADDSVPWTTSSLAETIPLRLRVFALLSRAVDDVPDRCNIKITDLYEKFVEKIAQLPATAFSRFIASHDSPLDVKPLVAIIRLLMPALLPGSIPDPRRVDPEADAKEAVSGLILEKCYLPFAYRTAENNAKLSVSIESLFRILWTSNCMRWTVSLQEAAEKGVKARNDKSAPKKSNRKEDSEGAAREILRSSGSRILALTQLLQLHASQNE